jgi:hypothetical protein
MPSGAELPSLHQIRELADQFGFEFSDQHVTISGFDARPDPVDPQT